MTDATERWGSITARALGATLAALALIACTTTVVEPAPPSGPCVERSGSYLVRITQRSGTCGRDGLVVERVVNLDATAIGELESTCTIDNSASADNCSIQFTTTCARDDLGPDYVVREIGKATWSQDGSTGSGTESLIIFRGDGIQECNSVLDITYARL